jgi:hypothetical protein
VKTVVLPFLALMALVFIPPCLVFPKVVRRETDPSGKLVAEVFVRPASSYPFGWLTTMLDGMTVDVGVRVRAPSGGVTEAALTDREDCIEDAREVEVRWLEGEKVLFQSRRHEIQILSWKQ